MSGLPFAAIVDIDVPLGADWTDPFQFVCVDPQGLIELVPGVYGRPLDLTDKSIEMIVLPAFGFSTPITTLSSPAQIVIDDAANGNCAMNVSASDKASWPVGSWVHVTRAISAAGKQELMRGAFRIYPG